MRKKPRERRADTVKVARGDKAVVMIDHGWLIGRSVPDAVRAPRADADEAWAKERLEFGRRWRTRTADWREQLRALGEPEDDIAELERSDACG